MNLSTVGELCSLVHLDDQKPTVDLSNISFVEPFGLVYLGMFLRHFNSLGKFFNIITPRSRQVTQYLESQRFWGRYNIAATSTDSQPLQGHARFTSLNDIVEIENNQYIAENVGDMVGDILRKNSVRVDVGLETWPESQHSRDRRFLGVESRWYGDFHAVCHPKLCRIGLEYVCLA